MCDVKVGYDCETFWCYDALPCFPICRSILRKHVPTFPHISISRNCTGRFRGGKRFPRTLSFFGVLKKINLYSLHFNTFSKCSFLLAPGDSRGGEAKAHFLPPAPTPSMKSYYRRHCTCAPTSKPVRAECKRLPFSGNSLRSSTTRGPSSPMGGVRGSW